MICSLQIVYISVEIYLNKLCISKFLKLNWKSQLKKRNLKNLKSQIFEHLKKNYLSVNRINAIYIIKNCRTREYLCQSLIWYLYTSTSSNPCYKNLIVVHLQHIWTHQHCHKEFLISLTSILFTKKCKSIKNAWFNR